MERAYGRKALGSDKAELQVSLGVTESDRGGIVRRVRHGLRNSTAFTENNALK